MRPRLGIQRRLLVAFSIPLVFALLVSVASVLYVVDRLLIHQVQRRVGADLRAAREIYDARLERLARPSPLDFGGRGHHRDPLRRPDQ